MKKSCRSGCDSMKKHIALLLSLVLLLSFPLSAFAHSGRTDGKGGHHDRTAGGYHYHHGYPAHQHTNGICPYAYDDQTDHSSHSSSSKATQSTSHSGNTTSKDDSTPMWLTITSAIAIGLFSALPLGTLLSRAWFAIANLLKIDESLLPDGFPFIIAFIISASLAVCLIL